MIIKNIFIVFLIGWWKSTEIFKWEAYLYKYKSIFNLINRLKQSKIWLLCWENNVSEWKKHTPLILYELISVFPLYFSFNKLEIMLLVKSPGLTKCKLKFCRKWVFFYFMKTPFTQGKMLIESWYPITSCN